MLLSQIAALVNGIQSGADCTINRIASPDTADAGSITFLSDEKHRQAIAECSAPAVIVRHGQEISGKSTIAVDDPYAAYARIAQHFEALARVVTPGVHSTAYIGDAVTLGERVSVGPLVHIGHRSSIGADAFLGPGVIIENDVSIGAGVRIDSGAIIREGCRIGDRVIIESGAVIGSNGFGNARERGVFIRIPSFGNVVVENDVWIGANTTIDRASFGSTVIEMGARIDNLVQIAHNCRVGAHVALAAQVGISGSTAIGARTIAGGQAGFAGHITVGEDSFIGAQSGIGKSFPAGSKISGTPARGLMQTRRAEAAQQKIPELLKRVRELEKELEHLRERLDDASHA